MQQLHFDTDALEIFVFKNVPKALTQCPWRDGETNVGCPALQYITTAAYPIPESFVDLFLTGPSAQQFCLSGIYIRAIYIKHRRREGKGCRCWSSPSPRWTIGHDSMSYCTRDLAPGLIEERTHGGMDALEN